MSRINELKNVAGDPILLHRMAQNYLVCVFPFPPGLRPAHLDASNREVIFEGLKLLHRAMRDLYTAFSRLEVMSEKAAVDEDTCWKTINGAGLLLWVAGVQGERRDGPQGPELFVKRSALGNPAPGQKINDIDAILPAMQAAGFRLSMRNTDNSPCSDGWKRCEQASLGWQKSPAEAEALLDGLAYFARRVNYRQSGVPFLAFQRADFRSLLPGVDPNTLPYTFEEALSTLDCRTATLWREIAGYLEQTYPRYVPFFRHPDLRHRTWAINYDTRPKGYGRFTLYGEEGGFRVRMALKKTGRAYVLGHLNEFTRRFQEMFLERITCVDCKHCGQHEFFTHDDHIHKLCAGTWFYSRYLEPEDIPSVKRLIAIHVSHLR